jgi:hypothetical protein
LSRYELPFQLAESKKIFAGLFREWLSPAKIFLARVWARRKCTMEHKWERIPLDDRVLQTIEKENMWADRIETVNISAEDNYSKCPNRIREM